MSPYPLVVSSHATISSVYQVSNIHELGLVTCSLDSTIKIIDLSRCKVLHTVTVHKRGVHCFAHSKAFSLCASGGLERDILLWQGSTNRQVGELTGHAASISHVAVDNRRCQVRLKAVHSRCVALCLFDRIASHTHHAVVSCKVRCLKLGRGNAVHYLSSSSHAYSQADCVRAA